MNISKNTLIGYGLLILLFIGYFWYNSKTYNAYKVAQEKVQDSLAKVQLATTNANVASTRKADSLQIDSTIRMESAGTLSKAAFGQNKLLHISNNLMDVAFSTQGGKVFSVTLKRYLSSYHVNTPVVLGSANNTIGYKINTSSTTSAYTNDLFFEANPIVSNVDNSKTISFSLKDDKGKVILSHMYIVHPDSYKIDWIIQIPNTASLFNNQSIDLIWHHETHQLEPSAVYEKQQSDICFYTNQSFDYISQHTSKKFDMPVGWLSMSQQFFSYAIVNPQSFTSGQVNWSRNPVEYDTNGLLATMDASLFIALPNSPYQVSIPLACYWGPNDYNILKNTAPEMDKIVNLGRDLYAFVRPINKYIVMPVFTFFASFAIGYGWVIALLTLFIRLIIAPLTYSSYKSGAKMKLLRPEIDALKKKFGSDQQGFAMEQMKLFKSAGVNPMGGCIPALLQIPIFFALYSFFNSSIALRQQPFLWAKDLSSFDVLVSWHNNIWLIGNHISMFTITAVITSLLISIYNLNMTPGQQDNPALKYMPYFFPIILFFVFNRLPAALTWYYTVSNIVTLLIQLVIQKYIIDHNDIMKSIEEKRKNAPTKKPSKWQEQYQKMLEVQKKAQALKEQQKKK